jgi:hypothetical protein
MVHQNHDFQLVKPYIEPSLRIMRNCEAVVEVSHAGTENY